MTNVVGYNVAVGGGMGRSHGNVQTFPRLADVIGFFRPEHVVEVAKAVLTTIHRDFGDRVNRKHARFKYVIEERGVDWARDEIGRRAGVTFAPARPFEFTTTGDLYGWHRAVDGSLFLTLFVETGRVKDVDGHRQKTALRRVAEQFPHVEFRLSRTRTSSSRTYRKHDRDGISALLASHGVKVDQQTSILHAASMACPALPTCGLALAESERMLPGLIDRIEKLGGELGLGGEEIIIRSTGCPNGCARPYMAEIAFVGKAPGRYQFGSAVTQRERGSIVCSKTWSRIRTSRANYGPSSRAGKMSASRANVLVTSVRESSGQNKPLRPLSRLISPLKRLAQPQSLRSQRSELVREDVKSFITESLSMSPEEISRINAELRAKSPLEIVRWAIAQAGGRAIVSTNFRPYEAVVLHLATQAQPDIPVLWVDHGYNRPATYKHAEELRALLKLNLKPFLPKMTAAHRDAIHGAIPTTEDEEGLKKFSAVMKLEPFQRGMKELAPTVWITALRKVQNPNRAELDIVSHDENFDALKVSPVFYFSDEEMEAYLGGPQSAQ